MAELRTFMVRVNDGQPIEFKTRHSEYSIAVLDAFGKLDLDYRCTVDIWSPDLVQDGCGPYRYQISDFVDWRGNVYGTPAVCSVRPVKKPTVTQ